MSSIISEFYGMEILMPRFKDAPPYFEVYYEGEVYRFSISPCRMLVLGNLSPVAQEAVQEWAQLHKSELEENWNRIESKQPFIKIEPIE